MNWCIWHDTIGRQNISSRLAFERSFGSGRRRKLCLRSDLAVESFLQALWKHGQAGDYHFFYTPDILTGKSRARFTLSAGR
jgi:hypothetical protein